MKAASITEIKKELKDLEPQEVIDLCLRLGRFKKENKELLSYLLFESYDEDAFIDKVKEECDVMLAEVNTSSMYYIKKSVRKVLRHLKKHIRYSDNKKTEVELLLYFCQKVMNFEPSLRASSPMRNLFDRQVKACEKALSLMHEDLQFDYRHSLEALSL